MLPKFIAPAFNIFKLLFTVKLPIRVVLPKTEILSTVAPSIVTACAVILIPGVPVCVPVPNKLPYKRIVSVPIFANTEPAFNVRFV